MAWEAVDVIDKGELDTKEKVYITLHEMANTKIVAEDGKIGGLKSITKQRVEAVKQAVADLKIKEAKIDEMLSNWEKQDFSQAVSEHNYIWSHYLHGTVGEAIRLREYK